MKKKVEIREEFHEILDQPVVLKKNAKRQILGCGEHKRSSKFLLIWLFLTQEQLTRMFLPEEYINIHMFHFKPNLVLVFWRKYWQIIFEETFWN